MRPPPRRHPKSLNHIACTSLLHQDPIADLHSYPLSNNKHKTDESEPEPIPEGVYVWPEEDPEATRGIPIFKPSMDEFKVCGPEGRHLTS